LNNNLVRSNSGKTFKGLLVIWYNPNIIAITARPMMTPVYLIENFTIEDIILI